MCCLLVAALATFVVRDFRSYTIHWTEQYRVDGDLLEVTVEGNSNYIMLGRKAFTQTVNIWRQEDLAARKPQLSYSFDFKGPGVETPLLSRLEPKPDFVMANVEQGVEHVRRDGNGIWAMERRK